MLRTAASILLALGVVTALFPRAAEAHMPPPVYMQLKITDEKTEVVLVISFDVFRDWFEIEPTGIAADGTLDEAQRAKIGTQMSPWLRVRIDGVPAEGQLVDAKPESFEDHMRTWEYVHLKIRYETQVPPRQVAFAWTFYGGESDWIFPSLDAELEAYGESDYPLFKEREPEYIWHRPREIVMPAPVVLPKPIDPPHVSLPLLSIAVIVLSLVLAWRGRGRYPRWAPYVALPVLFGLAVLVDHVGRVDLPLPFGGGLERPPDDEAVAIFASLHRGVYEAVGGETEEQIYESLAESVTDKLLPVLYMDIHQSLILQNEGGAIAKIQKTEISDTQVLPTPEDDGAWFEVRARWIVEGKVGHWGHTHQRLNEYEADVTVVADEGRWKIGALEILDETRIDDGKKVR